MSQRRSGRGGGLGGLLSQTSKPTRAPLHREHSRTRA